MAADLPDRVDGPMRRASALVEAHIAEYGMVPHPDKIKEAIAAALRVAASAPSMWPPDEHAAESTPITVTIFASGDGENTPAEAVHHALAYAQKAGFIDGWSDPASAPSAPEPVMWVCLVPGPAPAGAEMRIRAWTADRKRMESLRAEGLDMQALYPALPSSDRGGVG